MSSPARCLVSLLSCDTSHSTVSLSSLVTLSCPPLARYNAKHDENQLEVYSLCARDDSQAIVPADARISKTFSNGDDVWVVPLAVAAKEDNSTTAKSDLPSDANGIDRSNLRAKDKSYYYWAHKPAGELPAPREAPKQIRKRCRHTPPPLPIPAFLPSPR